MGQSCERCGRHGPKDEEGSHVKLVVTEKNDAATKIASLLGAKKPKADKVYSRPCTALKSTARNG